MKTKKILIGCLVVTFAIGGVLASAFASLPPYVDVYQTQQDFLENNISCSILSDITCESTGPQFCRVEVQVTFGGNQTDATFEDPICTIRMRDYRSGPIISGHSVYALADPN